MFFCFFSELYGHQQLFFFPFFFFFVGRKGTLWVGSTLIVNILLKINYFKYLDQFSICLCHLACPILTSLYRSIDGIDILEEKFFIKYSIFFSYHKVFNQLNLHIYGRIFKNILLCYIYNNAGIKKWAVPLRQAAGLAYQQET